VQLGSSFGFVGSDASEAVYVSGATWDLASDSRIAMGGGFDMVWLENYLPGSVDLGEGRGDLQLDALVHSVPQADRQPGRVPTENDRFCAVVGSRQLSGGNRRPRDDARERQHR